MLRRIFAVTENGWVEIVKGKALALLVGAVLLGFAAPLYAQYKWILVSGTAAQSSGTLAHTLIVLDKILLAIGLCASVFIGAGSVGSEVSKRTLTSVMIRPIHRIEYLAGRALSVMLFFFAFAAAAVLCAYVGAALVDCSVPGTFFLGLIQRVSVDVAWILIAVAVGAISSAASAITLIVLLCFLAKLTPYLPGGIHWSIPLFQKGLLYGMPCAWANDFWERTSAAAAAQALPVNALIVLENLMYGVFVFLVCSWYFTRRDLRLRD